MIPKVALVGRTNVGKSTLFNRLVEARKALVSEIAGTTRDRQEADCFWRGTIVRLVDTGGQDIASHDTFDLDVREQAALAVKSADLILFVVDVQTGVTPDDRTLAKALRGFKKPILLIANKCDKARDRRAAENPEWKALGHGAAIAVSSVQGAGVGDLLDQIWQMLETKGTPPSEVSDAIPTRVMVLGTPNVGKSSLLNAVIGEKRFIVSPIAHTTREPNDTLLTIEDKRYILIDSAGVRKLAGVRKRGGLEEMGVKKTLDLLPKADVVLYVLDITAPIGAQEKHLAGEIIEFRTGIIVVANKWDLVEGKTPTTQNEYLQTIAGHLPFLGFAPIIFTSALTKQHIDKIFKAVAHVQNERYRFVEEEELENFLKEVMRQHRPSRGKGVAHPKIIRFRQTRVAPPRFELTVKGGRADALHPSYLRFLENRLRERYGFDGTPIVIESKAVRKTT